MSKRRSSHFGGSGAAFDSHSGLSLMDSDEHFHSSSPRWNRKVLTGQVVQADLEDLHESMHWIQFMSTGTGTFLNGIRALRDQFILASFREDPEQRIAEIRDRVLKGHREPIYEYESILEFALANHGGGLAQNAVILDFAERLFYDADYVHKRKDFPWVIAFAAYLLLPYPSEDENRPDLDSFLRSYSKNSIGAKQPFLGGKGPFSTEQLLEAHSVLIEQFYLAHFDHQTDAQSRFNLLKDGGYHDAIAFFSIAVSKKLSDEEWQKRSREIGVWNIWTTLLVCIDVALDLHIPSNSDWDSFSEFDLYPPCRFLETIRAVDEIGFFNIVSIDSNSRAKLFEYRENIKRVSGLKVSTDSPFHRPEQFPMFSVLSEVDTTEKLVMNFSQFGQDASLYAVVGSIQEFFHSVKLRHERCYLYDPILNLSNDHAPNFCNFYDPGDWRVTSLSKPLVLLYSNGTVGLSDRMRLLAYQLFRSSIISYGRYSIAFEAGTINLSPRDLSPNLTLGPESLSDKFLNCLIRDIAR